MRFSAYGKRPTHSYNILQSVFLSEKITKSFKLLTGIVVDQYNMIRKRLLCAVNANTLDCTLYFRECYTDHSVKIDRFNLHGKVLGNNFYIYW